MKQEDAEAEVKPIKVLSSAAKRALKEAEQRRAKQTNPPLAKELGGRGGEEPVRYGDWEINGIAQDF